MCGSLDDFIDEAFCWFSFTAFLECLSDFICQIFLPFVTPIKFPMLSGLLALFIEVILESFWGKLTCTVVTDGLDDML